MVDDLDLNKASENLRKAKENLQRLFGGKQIKDDTNYLHKIIESMNHGDLLILRKDLDGKVHLKMEQTIEVKK